MNAEKLPTMRSAVLDGWIVRLANGTRCAACGDEVRCDPEPLDDGGWRLLCRHHHQVVVYERTERAE